MRFTFLITTFFLVYTCGCDFYPGMTRKAELAQMPNMSILVNKIKNYPGITDVEYAQNMERDNGYVLYLISYQGEYGIKANLSLREYDDHVLYNNHFYDSKSSITMERINATVLVMQRMEKDISNLIGYNFEDEVIVNYYKIPKPDIAKEH